MFTRKHPHAIPAWRQFGVALLLCSGLLAACNTAAPSAPPELTPTEVQTTHPRLWLNDEKLAKVRRIIQVPGTPQETWKRLLERVATGIGAYNYRFGEGEARWAREAALAYQVTGDLGYAQTAFTAFMAAYPNLTSASTGGGSWELELGNAVTPLAQAYDWAYPGWSVAQRAQAPAVFKDTTARFAEGDHPNITLPDKASNWVAVVRGAELTQHLVARGDGDYGLYEGRILELVEELRQHLESAYAETGWDQEGLDYLSYGLAAGGAPAALGALDAGYTQLQAAWERPQFWNLFLHSLSIRPSLGRLQWGVGEMGGFLGISPLIFATVPKKHMPAWLWLYERRVGNLAANPSYGGSLGFWSLIYWPEGVAAKDPDTSKEARRALLDDHGGAYQFRNRYQDPDDVLLGVTNHNHDHIGWSGQETFALSLMSHDTTWARMPAKAQTNALLYSKPLVDGVPEPTRRSAAEYGKTLASFAYPNQGGGYLSLDGSANFGVEVAQRDMVVDMKRAGSADATFVIHDRFADDTAHDWVWQLVPETGVTMSYGTLEDGAQTFVFSKGDAWLKGWLLEPGGATMNATSGAFRITRSGAEADFYLVLAVGRGTPPTAAVNGTALKLGDTTFETADLESFKAR